jgi:general secretion pathway protein A
VTLGGRPELQPVLARPEMSARRQRIASRCVLRPLSPAETRAYIAERLHAAGLRAASPFTGPALDEIHAVTKGVPRLINLVCDGALSLGFSQQRKQIAPDLITEAAAVLELTEASIAPPSRSAIRPAGADSTTAKPS